MSKVRCSFDGVVCEVEESASVLEAALSSGIDIAHLCHLSGRMRRRASCGLCFVEVAGLPAPVRACELKVREGMEVFLGTPRALELARGAFRLIMADHTLECATCARNGGCELHHVAKQLGLSLRSDYDVGESAHAGVEGLLGSLSIDRGKCILCARCVEACAVQGASLLELFGRGARSYVGALDVDGLAISVCPSCQSCLQACPAAALALSEPDRRLISPLT